MPELTIAPFRHGNPPLARPYMGPFTQRCKHTHRHACTRTYTNSTRRPRALQMVRGPNYRTQRATVEAWIQTPVRLNLPNLPTLDQTSPMPHLTNNRSRPKLAPTHNERTFPRTNMAHGHACRFENAYVLFERKLATYGGAILANRWQAEPPQRKRETN